MLEVRFRRTASDPAAFRVLPLAEGAPPPEPWREAAAAAGFAGRAGQVLAALAPARALLVGVGRAPLRRDWEAAGGAAIAAAAEATRLVIDARAETVGAALGLATGAALRAWRFDRHRREAPPMPQRLEMLVEEPALFGAGWDAAAAAVEGCLYARDLVAEPANHLTPGRFARRLEALSEHGIAVEVFGRKRLAKHGFGALRAVGGGAAHGPKLVVLRWRGSFAAPPVVFVGKGICFDTGGISIKPAKGMEEMRADMAGAAACAGAMLALARRRCPAPAAAVLALAENAVGAASYRPGDVLRTHAGRTVEVVDTDAEGRLVLADALHHAVAALKPRAMVDLATLTGAIVRALGHHRAGLYGNDESLAARCMAAGEAVGERLWPMPIGAALRADLASDIADLRQCAPSGGGPLPDAGHAAAFLREFAGTVPWAHLDIAGVETREADAPDGPKGPTGFGARLLDRLVALGFETEPE
jgi:leucyl aminopeptidase